MRGPIAAAGVVALVFLVLAAALLGERDVRLAETNGLSNESFVLFLQPGDEGCEANIFVPRDAAGVEFYLGTYGRPGPPLTVLLRDSSGTVLRRGSLGSGYEDAGWQLVRFGRVQREGSDYAVCLRAGGRLAVAGKADPLSDPRSELLLDGTPQQADIAYRMVRDGRESLLSLVPEVIRRAERFRPDWFGPWTFYVAGLLLLFAGVLAVVCIAAAASGRIQTGGQIAVIALVAALNALVWSVVMPSFQPPDEASHYAYAASLAELHRRPYTDPGRPGGSFSAEENLALEHVAVNVVQRVEARPPWSAYDFAQWEQENATIAARRPELVGGGWTTASAYSPLYYALAAPLYAAGEDSSVFTRLWLMRLLSVLMAAGTAVCAFLAGREVLPHVRWAPAAAGASVAFLPMFAQLGGAVNNDNLLILLASLELYLLVRALRRGLTLASGVAIGAVLGLGIIAKPNMYAFVPVVALALGWIVVRERRRLRAIAAPVLLTILAAGLVTLAGYMAFRQSEFATDTASSPGVGVGGGGGGFRLLASYFWQWYLPALPWMESFWGAVHDVKLPVWDIYFRGFWADFAHLDTQFPGWVYYVLALFSIAALAAIVVAVIRERERRSILVAQVVVLGSAVAMTAILVTYRSYLALVQSNFQPFAQGRYLLQGVVVFGVAVALAARGLGERRGPSAAAAIVTGLFAFNVFSLGLVLTRFYT